MAEETDELLFHIIGPDQECTFTLFRYDTVEDLKNEIYERFQIVPHNQIIESWYRIPQSDSNTLDTCCKSEECNVLILYDASSNDEYVSSDTEMSSIQSFKEYFSEQFYDNGIIFKICLLEDAINKVLTPSSSEKKILVLHLNIKTSDFGKGFCQKLTQANIQQLLNEKTLLLCWDIENERYKPFLIKALQKHNPLKGFSRFIEKNICATLIVVPKNHSVGVMSVMKSLASLENFLSILEQANKEFLNNPNSITDTVNNTINNNDSEQSSTSTDTVNNTINNNDSEQSSTFGSRQYQQLMLDLLGDRDYDSFENNEHEHLENKIGFALYGPPQEETGYTSEQKTKIDFLFTVILTQSNLITKWKDRVIISCVYVCTEPLEKEKRRRATQFSDYNPDCDFTPVPIFILRKCKHANNACRIFIDDTGRVYFSWEQYLEKNKLPKCEMIYPLKARYQEDRNGHVILDTKKSPACDLINSVLETADVVGAVGGVGSGGAMLAAAAIPSVAAAPFVIPVAGAVGIAAGVYSLGRSAYSLYDKHTHRESLNFFDSPEVRGAYINIVAGSLGFVGAGANVVVSRLASQGYNFGQGATAAVNAINIANLSAGGIGVANASYDVIRNWVCENERPSLLTIVQLSSSILFFGHAVYNYRSMNTIIEESQANTLKEYQDSLRSNRHRKAFTKMMKETIRQNSGNVQQAQSEVISTIKNIQNKDEVFATLTRANRNMNQNNVRFAAQDGKITLNGVPVDMVQFSAMEKNDVITFLRQLPSKPNPSSPNVRNMVTYLQNFEGTFGIGSTDLSYLAVGLVRMFGSTSQEIKEKIFDAVSKLIVAIQHRYMNDLNRMFRNYEKYFRLFNMVNSFFQQKVNEIENRFQRWRQLQRSTEGEESFFPRLSLDAAERATEIFKFVTTNLFTGGELNENGLRELLNYFYTWFARQVCLFEERQVRRNLRIRHASTPSRRVNCELCGGYYYSPQQ